jgi:hypothetical protein
LHFTSFSTGIGCKIAVSRTRKKRSDERAHLFDLFGFEDVLHDLVVRDVLVLVFRVHLDAIHWDVTWAGNQNLRTSTLRDGAHTVDCIEDLAVSAAAAALLDLCVVYLEELVEPG